MVNQPVSVDPQNDPFQYAFSNTARIVLQRLVHFRVLPSTNVYAKTQGEAGEPEGLVVLADTQTAGTGRFARSWHSPPGGLYFSILLRPSMLTPSETQLITLTVGVAVAKVLQQAYGVQATLKWPNDVQIDRRKVAGILAEQSLTGDHVEYVVVGIGVNVNIPLDDFPEELTSKATSLQEVLGHPVELPRLFGYLSGQLEYWYIRLRDKGFPTIAPHWRKFCTHLGRSVTVTSSEGIVKGIAQDIAPDGSLILSSPTGKQILRSGDLDYHPELP